MFLSNKQNKFVLTLYTETCSTYNILSTIIGNNISTM